VQLLGANSLTTDIYVHTDGVATSLVRTTLASVFTGIVNSVDVTIHGHPTITADDSRRTVTLELRNANKLTRFALANLSLTLSGTALPTAAATWTRIVSTDTYGQATITIDFAALLGTTTSRSALLLAQYASSTVLGTAAVEVRPLPATMAQQPVVAMLNTFEAGVGDELVLRLHSNMVNGYIGQMVLAVNTTLVRMTAIVGASGHAVTARPISDGYLLTVGSVGSNQSATMAALTFTVVSAGPAALAITRQEFLDAVGNPIPAPSLNVPFLNGAVLTPTVTVDLSQAEVVEVVASCDRDTIFNTALLDGQPVVGSFRILERDVFGNTRVRVGGERCLAQAASILRVSSDCTYSLDTTHTQGGRVRVTVIDTRANGAVSFDVQVVVPSAVRLETNIQDISPIIGWTGASCSPIYPSATVTAHGTFSPFATGAQVREVDVTRHLAARIVSEASAQVTVQMVDDLAVGVRVQPTRAGQDTLDVDVEVRSITVTAPTLVVGSTAVNGELAAVVFANTVASLAAETLTVEWSTAADTWSRGMHVFTAVSAVGSSSFSSLTPSQVALSATDWLQAGSAAVLLPGTANSATSLTVELTTGTNCPGALALTATTPLAANIASAARLVSSPVATMAVNTMPASLVDALQLVQTQSIMITINDHSISGLDPRLVAALNCTGSGTIAPASTGLVLTSDASASAACTLDITFAGGSPVRHTFQVLATTAASVVATPFPRFAGSDVQRREVLRKIARATDAFQQAELGLAVTLSSGATVLLRNASFDIPAARAVEVVADQVRCLCVQQWRCFCVQLPYWEHIR
jgi:hypothetical protein